MLNIETPHHVSGYTGGAAAPDLQALVFGAAFDKFTPAPEAFDESAA
jgi:hypothetical protein